MEIQGRIIQKFNVQSGTSARGAWCKQDFLVEYQERNFPSKLYVTAWGDDKIKELDKYNEGDVVKLSFNLNSRERNGYWFTDVSVWRIEPAVSRPQPSSTPSTGPAVQANVPPPTIDDMICVGEDDDIPF